MFFFHHCFIVLFQFLDIIFTLKVKKKTWKVGLGPKTPPPHCGLSPSKCFLTSLIWYGTPRDQIATSWVINFTVMSSHSSFKRPLVQSTCLVMNLKIKISLCALNRQPSGFHGALYSSMSAAMSRYSSMDPRGWVSIIRTPFLYIADSTNRVKFSSMPWKPLKPSFYYLWLIF